MKKAIIVFDTVSGSTREMAEIIRDEMKGLSIDIARVDYITSLKHARIDAL